MLTCNEPSSSLFSYVLDRKVAQSWTYIFGSLNRCPSKPVPVNKKKGSICVCTKFRDLNMAYLEDNFPTHFIDQILDECVGSDIFSFLDDFSEYNHV